MIDLVPGGIYDQAGDLISVKRPQTSTAASINQSLAYDATGLLASKTTGVTTQHFAWDSSTSLPLLLNDGENSYVYGPGGLPIEQISSGEKPTYLHHDQLGSTRLLTDASGNTTATSSYQPFGTLEAKTGTATTPLSFAGQYTDAETGLQYLRARFYDPETAQFLTRDPLEALTRQPYAYAEDNPIWYADRTGLAREEEHQCFGCLPIPIAEDYKKVGEEIAKEAQEMGEEAEEAWNWITGSDESSSQPTLSKAEEEYEEEHHECPLERNWKQDKKVTERELEEAGFEEAGLDAHELKRGGRGTDIYKDRKGNLYEKPHGGRGPGDPLGINIKDLLR